MIRVFFGSDDGIKRSLIRIERTLINAIQHGVKIMATLDEVLTKMEAVSGNVESMRVFVQGLEKQLAEALSGVKLSPAAQAKVDAVFAKATAQSEAIVAAIDNDPNTPGTGTGGAGGVTGAGPVVVPPV